MLMPNPERAQLTITNIQWASYVRPLNRRRKNHSAFSWLRTLKQLAYESR